MNVGTAALKGHGFSRAESAPGTDAASAAEGMLADQCRFPRGLKPRPLFCFLLARLKPRPFKASCQAVCAAFLAFCAIAVLLALATLCDAQQRSLSPKDHAKDSALQLAQRVDRHYNQLHSLKAGFTESYEGLGIKRAESGTLLLLKPGRMRWDYISPPGKLFLLDGKYAWFYASGDSQVQRIAAKQLDDLRSPLRFLLGHTELEKELNNLTMASAPNGLFTLTGQPRGEEKRVARLTLTVTAEGAIAGIEVVETDGALTRFTFTGEAANAPVAPEAFRFTPPAGIPVVDALPPV
jgi:outer membrane lipoprotein carrier protein